MRPSALALGKGDSASQSLPRVCRRNADTKHVKHCMCFFHEPQKSCSLLEMGTDPFLVRLRLRRDCATRGNIHRFIASVNPSYSGKNLRSKVFHCVRVERICKICVLTFKKTCSPVLQAPPSRRCVTPYESALMRSMTTAKYACWAASLKNERSTNRLIASNALTAALSSFVIRVGGMFKRCPNTSKSTRR